MSVNISDFSKLNTPQIICNIIQQYMGLSDDQIWIYNQRRKIPPTEGLFVVVSFVSRVAYGNNNAYLPDVPGCGQNLQQFMQETLSINLFSYDTQAIDRMPEMLGSLKSVYSEQVQEKVPMQIGTVPISINDTSFLEASAILFRETVTIRVLRSYSQERNSDYYNNFKTEIYNETGKVAENVND